MFMKRDAEDEISALRIADAMESVGATVVAITTNGEATYPGAMASHQRFIVWARINDSEHADRVDGALEQELGRR